MTFSIGEDGEVESDGVGAEDVGEGEETPEVTPFVVTKKPSAKGDLSDAPVENAMDVPLFAEFSKKGLKTVAYLRVTKLNSPGNGFKGNVAITSTLETIAQLYGNGLYTIEACNHKHQAIRIKENVSISLPTSESVEKKVEGVVSGESTKDKHITQLIGGLTESHKSEVKRIEDLSQQVNKQITSQGETFVKLIQTTTESAAQREREHMAGVNAGQQDFFKSMFLMSQQMFQQTMAMMMAGHQQQMEMLRASSERNANEPMTMVQMLMKGLELGKELEGDDSPDYVKALSAGGEALGNLVQLAKVAPQGFTRPMVANPSQPVVTPAPTTTPVRKPAPRVFEDKEIVELLKLKKVLRSRGIAIEDVAREASKHYQSVPDSELFGESDEDEAAIAKPSEETPNLEGGRDKDASGAT